ncbi:MAG: tryptophan synthase subunit alpha [Planctomycetota bacterium]|jgi:tryptophan synthase alpha chain
MSLDGNRIVSVFAELRSGGRKTVLPFLTAGYPDLAATEAMLADLERRGVRICELGIPFSDPIADGPTIQASYTAALDGGVTCQQIFEMVRRYRAAGGQMALAAMVSYSIVFRHGVEAYLAEAASAGFDGVIIPDLPVEEAATAEKLAADVGLANILLIAPTSPPARRVEIAKQSRGFIYYISVAGITGERDKLPPDTIDAVAELRAHTDTPIAVGFGISNPAMVSEVCAAADGAIVGSAIIHRITDAMSAGQDALVKQVGGFVSELMGPLA